LDTKTLAETLFGMALLSFISGALFTLGLMGQYPIGFRLFGMVSGVLILLLMYRKTRVAIKLIDSLINRSEFAERIDAKQLESSESTGELS